MQPYKSYITFHFSIKSKSTFPASHYFFILATHSMESSIFPTTFKLCTCQSEVYNSGQSSDTSAGLSHFTFPDPAFLPIPNSFSSFSYPSLDLNPFLPLQVDPEIHFSSTYTLQPDSETPWIKRLENLERVVEQLQTPVDSQHQNQTCSRLEGVENLMQGIESKVNDLQQAISSLGAWAEIMNIAHKEFKGVVCDVYKLVNSRQHFLDLLNATNISTQS